MCKKDDKFMYCNNLSHQGQKCHDPMYTKQYCHVLDSTNKAIKSTTLNFATLLYYYLFHVKIQKRNTNQNK